MKSIFLIRHAESVGNAGEKTSDSATIALSQKGEEQALALVPLLENREVKQVYTSPFLRTQLTAKPFLTAHPEIPWSILDIEEFSFLEPSRVVNTTEAERKEFRKEFWDAMDPDLTDGPNSESFAMFLKRVIAFKELLPQLPENTAVFGHGRFYTMLLLLIQNPGTSMTELMTILFQTLHVEKRNFRNAKIVEITIEGEKINTPEIPIEL